jgi:Domain of unknown function (DUF4279)
MGPLKRAVASLDITGDDLRPEDISAALGAKPTGSHTKGQALPLKAAVGVRIAKTGVWSLQASATENGDFDAQVEEILSCLTSDLATWRDLSSRFYVRLFCGWFLGSSNEGVEIAPSTLSALGERGIELSLDIYERDKSA